MAATAARLYLPASMLYSAGHSLMLTHGATYKKYEYKGDGKYKLRYETPMLMSDRALITAYHTILGPLRFPFALYQDICRAEIYLRDLNVDNYELEAPSTRDVGFANYFLKL